MDLRDKQTDRQTNKQTDPGKQKTVYGGDRYDDNQNDDKNRSRYLSGGNGPAALVLDLLSSLPSPPRLWQWPVAAGGRASRRWHTWRRRCRVPWDTCVRSQTRTGGRCIRIDADSSGANGSSVCLGSEESAPLRSLRSFLHSVPALRRLCWPRRRRGCWRDDQCHWKWHSPSCQLGPRAFKGWCPLGRSSESKTRCQI